VVPSRSRVLSHETETFNEDKTLNQLITAPLQKHFVCAQHGHPVSKVTNFPEASPSASLWRPMGEMPVLMKVGFPYARELIPIFGTGCPEALASRTRVAEALALAQGGSP
jgi:hypothetical protein